MPSVQGHEPVPGQKLTFFCHGCGFEGGMNDDFEVEVADDHLEIRCPECATLLSRRPRRTS